MVMNRDRERLFRFVLADDVIVKVSFDVDRARNFESRFRDFFAFALFGDNIVTQLDTLVANVNARACDQRRGAALRVTRLF